MNKVIKISYNLFTIFAIFFKNDHSFNKAIYNIAIQKINLNGENIKAKEALQSLVILIIIKFFTPI